MATQSLPTIATQAPPSISKCVSYPSLLCVNVWWNILMAKGEDMVVVSDLPCRSSLLWFRFCRSGSG